MVLVKPVPKEGADEGKERAKCKGKINFRVERLFVRTQLTHSKFFLLHRSRNVLDINNYFNHRTRGNHRARINASYGTYDYDDGISDVTYAKALKKGNEVPDYVMDFERHGTGQHYDAWTQTSMDDETIRSYVDEIRRLRKVVDAMGDHGHKLKERVQVLRVAHGEIGAVLHHLNTARTSFNDLVKYAHDHGVDLPREGGVKL
jgi:hypothetical protein